MKEVKELVQLIKDIKFFEFYFFNNNIIINGQYSGTEYSLNLENTLFKFEQLLNEIFKITDIEYKVYSLKEIYGQFEKFKIVQIKLQDFPYTAYFEYTDGPVEFSNWSHYLLEIGYTDYLSYNVKLRDCFISGLLKNGFIIENEFIVIANSRKDYVKGQILTKFDVKQLGYFLYLMKESGIFSAKNKTEIAEMISNFLINGKKEHFSKDSLANKMISDPENYIKENVKNALESIIRKIK